LAPASLVEAFSSKASDYSGGNPPDTLWKTGSARFLQLYPDGFQGFAALQVLHLMRKSDGQKNDLPIILVATVHRRHTCCDVNSKLPDDARVRIVGRDPGPGDNRSRETAAVSVLKEQVLQKHGKAPVIYGAHFYPTMNEDYLSSMGDDIGIARKSAKWLMRAFILAGRRLVLRKQSQVDRRRGWA
jgi:hypothetical protein